MGTVAVHAVPHDVQLVEVERTVADCSGVVIVIVVCIGRITGACASRAVHPDGLQLSAGDQVQVVGGIAVEQGQTQLFKNGVGSAFTEHAGIIGVRIGIGIGVRIGIGIGVRIRVCIGVRIGVRLFDGVTFAVGGELKALGAIRTARAAAAFLVVDFSVTPEGKRNH